VFSTKLYGHEMFGSSLARM